MEWITIKEASKVTGKSASTIRRLIDKRHDEEHGNGLICKKDEKSKRQTWLINKESLLTVCSDIHHESEHDNVHDKDHDNAQKTEDHDQFWKDQIEIKDAQIKALNVHLMQANERVKMLEDRISEMETEGNERKGRGLLGRIIKMLPV